MFEKLKPKHQIYLVILIFHIVGLSAIILGNHYSLMKKENSIFIITIVFVFIYIAQFFIKRIQSNAILNYPSSQTVNTQNIPPFRFIYNITPDSFEIKTHNPDISSQKIEEMDGIQYKWVEISDIKINPSKESITIKDKDNKEEKIENSISGWYDLISKIPTKYPSFNMKIVDEIFQNFSACKTCGKTAVMKEECYNCGTESWTKEKFPEYKNEIDYIKSYQIAHHLLDVDSNTDLSSLKPKQGFDCFKSDPKWRMLVSKKEILDFKKQFEKHKNVSKR